MGRRTAKNTASRLAGLQAATEGMVLPAVGFALEVAMLASFVYWGFRQAGPWNFILGLGIPAAVVVLWGIFLAPKCARRLPLNVVSLASLALFLLAGGALLAAGATAPGIALMVFAAAWFAASRVVQPA
ncbi:YrdB family protein [Arthrobacter sp. SDTb3-6]|uniref:YrdB family protein n=1 Tax=Arthrobacter sp. SDTb3-6 TaxID=2713571 RepID=UPI00159D56EC|nr:YrdB family protein [Arthrobacter sp. SDTb3-6]NVM97443.1 YrdB family protein [Arthrobacter sp. SDTb3-6]